MIGWIKLHRKLQECFLWVDKEPYDRRSAWIDLLLSANHEEKKLMFDGKPIIVNRGDKLTSILALSDRWHWSRHKVSDFLNVLENEQMITQKRDNKKTLITIVNYGIYQDIEEEKGHQKDIKRTSEGHQKDTNKNIKNDKNEKNNNIIPPKVEWIESYCKERNNTVDAQQFFDFYESKNWFIGKNKMKDWKAAVRTWERNRKDNKQDFKKSNYNFNELQKMIDGD